MEDLKEFLQGLVFLVGGIIGLIVMATLVVLGIKFVMWLWGAI